MYVVQSADTPRRLVVAIWQRPGSAFDILIEDLFVEQQVPWPSGNPSGRREDLGRTLRRVRGVAVPRAGSGMPGANQRLRAFLQSAMTEPASVVDRGTRSGGTLSAADRALARHTQAAWDPRGKATILCQPSAA